MRRATLQYASSMLYDPIMMIDRVSVALWSVPRLGDLNISSRQYTLRILTRFARSH